MTAASGTPSQYTGRVSGERQPPRHPLQEPDARRGDLLLTDDSRTPSTAAAAVKLPASTRAKTAVPFHCCVRCTGRLRSDHLVKPFATLYESVRLRPRRRSPGNC